MHRSAARALTRPRRTPATGEALLLALAAGFLLLALSAAPLPAQTEPVEVTWPTSDEKTVHATWYGAVGGPPRGIIMALHQAGASGRGEYGPIIPRLAEAGWDVVAVDLRKGGSRFGGVNRTAQAPEEVGYCAVEPDILGGVSYVRAVRADIPLVLMGSSYSGALAMRAAATHDADVSAVVAFSPATGGPMADCRGEDATEELLAPVLVLRPASEMDRAAARRQFERLQEQGHQTFVAEPGVHGSSMLVEERVGGDVEDTWRVVEDFLLSIGPEEE